MCVCDPRSLTVAAEVGKCHLKILDPILPSDESDAVKYNDLRKIIKAQNSRYNEMYPSS